MRIFLSKVPWGEGVRDLGHDKGNVGQMAWYKIHKYTISYPLTEWPMLTFHLRWHNSKLIQKKWIVLRGDAGKITWLPSVTIGVEWSQSTDKDHPSLFSSIKYKCIPWTLPSLGDQVSWTSCAVGVVSPVFCDPVNPRVFSALEAPSRPCWAGDSTQGLLYGESSHRSWKMSVKVSKCFVQSVDGSIDR